MCCTMFVFVCKICFLLIYILYLLFYLCYLDYILYNRTVTCISTIPLIVLYLPPSDMANHPNVLAPINIYLKEGW